MAEERDSSALLMGEGPPDSYTSYSSRWWLLLAFSLSNAANAFLWISFAPSFGVFASFWGVSSLAVNQLSSVFLALFLPGSLVAAVGIERWGLRATLLAGVGANALGALLRYGGGLVQSPSGFAVTMVGQCVAALAQPIFTNAPARIAADWFPARQRDMGTVIASLSNAVGTALGSALPGFLVNGPADVAPILLGQAVACGVLLVLAVACIRADRPPTPPSAAAALRNKGRAAHLPVDGLGDDSGGAPAHTQSVAAAVRAVLVEYGQLLRGANFRLLVVGFGVGLGLFNALLTLLAQVLAPCGYDADTSSYAGGALLLTGLISAGVAGAVLEMTHAYVTMLRGGILFAGAALVFFLSSLRHGAPIFAIASSALLGFCLIPLLPIALENAAEVRRRGGCV